MSNNLKQQERSKKVEFIKRKIDDLIYEDRINILELLRQHVDESLIIENADGVRVNLDKIPTDVINKIEYVLIAKLKVSEISMI
jgi:hypothetical protein